MSPTCSTPDEYKLIETALATAGVFAELTGGIGGSAVATAKHPVVVAKAIVHNPELDEVMSAAREILDFKTTAGRDNEAGRIMSIIDPRLGRSRTPRGPQVHRRAQASVLAERRPDEEAWC